VAEEGGHPVGYIFGQYMPDYSLPTLQAVYLVSIGFDPGHQGKGWGAALLSAWLRKLYAHGIRAIELDVDAEIPWPDLFTTNSSSSIRGPSRSGGNIWQQRVPDGHRFQAFEMSRLTR